MVLLTQEVKTPQPNWGVVVFAARETADSVLRTLDAIRAAAPQQNLVVDVLVNGNPELATSLKPLMQQTAGVTMRLWAIGIGDKSNAWSQYLHQIWSGEELVFFIDGYVRVWPDALRSLGAMVTADAQALGGTGVPTSGRSAWVHAKEMLRKGGFHGNLCCIKGSVISEMRRLKIELPIGLYRVDSLVAALLCFSLDPRADKWSYARIRVDGNASWDIDGKSWWNWRDIVGKYKRSLRQARGVAENAAIKEHLAVRRDHPATLPRHVSALLKSWRAANPHVVRGLAWRNPLLHRALQKAPETERCTAHDLRPTLMWSSGA